MKLVKKASTAFFNKLTQKAPHPGRLLRQIPRRVSRPMGAKGTEIIFGGGVYVAENTLGSQ